MREDIGLAFDAGGIKRESGRIRADALPVFHLALIAFFRDLRVEIDRRQRMDNKGGKRRRVGGRLCFGQFLPMRVGAFTETRYNSNAGDPDFPGALSHWLAPRTGSRLVQRYHAFAFSFRRSENRERVASMWRRRWTCRQARSRS